MLDTSDELASAVAGGIPFLIQPPLPPSSLFEGDLRHLLGLYAFNDVPVVTPSGTSRAMVAAMYYPATRTLVLRSWLEDENGVLQATPLDLTSSGEVYNDAGELIAHGTAGADPAGTQFLTLTFQVALSMSSAYRVHADVAWAGGSFARDFLFSVTR